MKQQAVATATTVSKDARAPKKFCLSRRVSMDEESDVETDTSESDEESVVSGDRAHRPTRSELVMAAVVMSVHAHSDVNNCSVQNSPDVGPTKMGRVGERARSLGKGDEFTVGDVEKGYMVMAGGSVPSSPVTKNRGLGSNGQTRQRFSLGPASLNPGVPGGTVSVRTMRADTVENTAMKKMLHEAALKEQREYEAKEEMAASSGGREYKAVSARNTGGSVRNGEVAGEARGEVAGEARRESEVVIKKESRKNENNGPSDLMFIWVKHVKINSHTPSPLEAEFEIFPRLNVSKKVCKTATSVTDGSDGTFVVQEFVKLDVGEHQSNWEGGSSPNLSPSGTGKRVKRRTRSQNDAAVKINFTDGEGRDFGLATLALKDAMLFTSDTYKENDGDTAVSIVKEKELVGKVFIRVVYVFGKERVDHGPRRLCKKLMTECTRVNAEVKKEAKQKELLVRRQTHPWPRT